MSKDILTEIFRTQAHIIYKYLRSHGCRKEEAEEIVQESFTKAVQHMVMIDPNKLPSWIFKVALNEYRNWLKRRTVLIEYAVDKGFFIRLASGEDITEDILVHESGEAVRACLGDLKESFRELLLFKYDLELSYQEIAALLGVPESTVKTYLYRARNEFKRLWRERYGR